ncbi:MAG: hypothetical protein LUH58_07840 [Lachnospiraceae bacterium]|nr:hypothetical protein [Lachnospiraceae bacterium]
MERYEKPVVLANEELAEGVYAASGASEDVTSSVSTVSCDSQYMNGVWQAPDYSAWADGESRGYRQQFGCLGCPAYRANGCGLLTDYVASGNASSYDVDSGSRMPSWEAKGYGPNDPVTDWNM